MSTWSALVPTYWRRCHGQLVLLDHRDERLAAVQTYVGACPTCRDG